MKTERGDMAQPVRGADGRPHGRWRTLLASPRAPWVIAPLALVLLWLTEAAVHVSLEPTASFVGQLFVADAHETWMRFLVVVMLLAFTAASSAGMGERARREREAADHRQALASATARSAHVESETRSRLSRRLHEGVGQELAAARMFLASVSDGVEDEAARLAIASAERVLARSIAECRDIAQELSPPVLDEYGLVPALELLAQRVTRDTGTCVTVESGECPSAHLERDVLMTAFRVVAAFVEQAAGCDSASSVRVSLFCDAGEAVVSMDWDGGSQLEIADAQARLARVGGRIEAGLTGASALVQLRVPMAA